MEDTQPPAEPDIRPSLGRRTAFAIYWNFIGRMALMGGRWIESVLLVWLLGTQGYGLFGAALVWAALA